MGEISREIVDYYTRLLGTEDTQVIPSSISELEKLFSLKLDVGEAAKLCCEVTNKETRDAMFSISSDKSPGPDGFGAGFFKHSWDLVGDDICLAVQQFFRNGVLHRSVNSTFLSLVPKKINVVSIKDYRPITCCNVLYKCITKVLATRMAPCLPDVISKTQSAFVKGRSIGDNILMAHELVNGYHQKHISPRCAIKIDLRKAFDSVNLSYVLNTMLAMGFPEKFVDWIRGCLSSVMLSAGVNGGSVGYFQGVKGLRQGDPLSPGLFVISMEGLHCFISRVVEMKKIPFHPMCKKVRIIDLCLADDLMVFTNGTAAGVLEIYKGIRQAIYDQTGFTEGKLPVWYLGVPLVSGKIKSKDCEVLIAKITSKIRGWNVRTLSYAGRLQLVKSVLSTMSQFWMAIFLLPKSIIKAVEKICNDFLWKVSEGERKKAKVAWPKLTFLKSEGRLDIKDLSIWNISCVIRHIWSILAAAGSIWVAWINLYRLKKVLFGIA
ncbi:Transposon TX1 uncharacterized 149 kDa protein [Linum perenne]